jgi:hypothetical protein
VLNYKKASNEDIIALCPWCTECHWCEDEYANMVKNNCSFLEKNHYNVFKELK